MDADEVKTSSVFPRNLSIKKKMSNFAEFFQNAKVL